MQKIWMILDVWNMKPAMECVYIYIVYVYNVHEIQTLKHVWLVVLTILKI